MYLCLERCHTFFRLLSVSLFSMHLLSAARQIEAARKACDRACERLVVINRAGLLKIPRQVPFRNGGRVNHAHKTRQFFCCLAVWAYLSQGFNYLIIL